MVSLASLDFDGPETWSQEPLGLLGKWLSGGTPRMANPEFWGGDIPWVSPKDMKLSRLGDAIDHVTAKALGNGTRLAPQHSLLLVVRGMILAHTFPVARAEVALAFNQDIKALIPRSGVDSDFLLWWLTANESVLLGVTTESTHGTKRVPMDELQAIVVALPTLPEQRVIAAALSDVDALLGGLDRFIAKKRDVKQAAMQQLLTGQTRLPGFQGEWEVTQLGEISTFHKGRGLPKSSLSIYGAEACIHYGELFTKYSEIIDLVLSRTDDTNGAFRSVANDVLMPTSDVTPRGLAKASSLTADGVILGGDILVIRSDTRQVSGAFLSYLIRHEENQVLQLVTGSTVFHLYGRDMAKFVFALPPVQEQTAIATILSDIDAELTALEARRTKTRALKQGMMQELLTGRTRLVRGAP